MDTLANLLERSEVRKVRFHDLRHTYATLMLLRNVHPKIAQEALGHANISVTLNRYSHFVPSLGKGTAAAMESAGHRGECRGAT
jgi:integrase